MNQEQHFHGPVGQVSGRDINNHYDTPEELRSFSTEHLVAAYNKAGKEIKQANYRKENNKPKWIVTLGSLGFILGFGYINPYLQRMSSTALFVSGLFAMWLAGLGIQKLRFIQAREDKRIKHLSAYRDMIDQELIRREMMLRVQPKASA